MPPQVEYATAKMISPGSAECNPPVHNKKRCVHGRPFSRWLEAFSKQKINWWPQADWRVARPRPPPGGPVAAANPLNVDPGPTNALTRQTREIGSRAFQHNPRTRVQGMECLVPGNRDARLRGGWKRFPGAFSRSHPETIPAAPAFQAY